MSELISGTLISGKEALLALANGEDVEFKRHVSDSAWLKARELKASEILNQFIKLGDSAYSIEFRIKPKTTTINGVKVPAPFTPKVGDECWYLDDLKGYAKVSCYTSNMRNFYGWWKTEDEIKQVAEAVKSTLKGG